ncbi:MAG: hypothetical protein EBZ77_04985, partial [Chitinophagia bacterium]|nr:hypothetical protein [Chitinophagia bacterium]
MVLGSATPGATITWSRDTVTGIANAMAMGNDTINETLHNTTVLPVTVVYVDTLRAAGCIHIQPVALSVNPIPVLSTPTPASVCDSTVLSITLGSATPGTTITWSRDTIPGVTNSPATGMDSISEVLVNVTPVPVNVVYFDTLTAGGCQNVQSHVVAVNPKPVLDNTTPTAVCSGSPVSFVLTSSTPGTTFSWFRAVVPGIANTFATGADTVNEILNTSTALPASVTYYDTLTAFGCTNVATVSITVNPLPVQPFLSEYTTCFEAAVEPYYLDAKNQGSTYVWSNDSTARLIAIDSPGNYQVWITTAEGCSLEFETAVEQECLEAVYVPTSFTPDGDGINDAW